MQYKTFAVIALSVGAIAAPEKRAASYDTASVNAVLLTALPESLLAIAITNSAAVYSQVASEFAAGETPSWYVGLPDDIKSILGAEAPAAASASATSSAVSSSLASITSSVSSAVESVSSAISSASSSAAVFYGNSTIANGTVISPGNSSSATSSAGFGVTTSTGGAGSISPAMVGMSLAGLMGLVGIFAL